VQLEPSGVRIKLFTIPVRSIGFFISITQGELFTAGETLIIPLPKILFEEEKLGGANNVWYLDG